MKKYYGLLLAVMILVADVGVTLAQKKGKPLYTFPFGVQAYTFRKSFPKGIAETLDTIKNMGITEIEGGGGNMPPEEFKKLCNDRGISIPSTGTGYEALVKDPLAAATTAKALGATYLMVAWIPHDKGKFNLDNAKKAVEDFNTAGKVLKENGITLCYHTHGFEFQPYEKGTLMDYLITNTNPEYVSFEMDILWTHFGGGDPVALLKKYGNRWKLLHVKDLRKGTPKDLTGGTSQENDVALGTGEIDLPGIIKEAKKIGIKHYFIEDESSKVITQVPQSIAYLKSLKE
ncbi:MAG TPA: sugar phosphate isomerase/epimerase [Chryseolinea sp.]|nr:sugar phosphate isomerase/epimerase [Chryseolinea sp.]